MTIKRFDSHQHFWRLNRGDYDWMSPGLTAIYRDFEPGELKPFMDKHHTVKTILVQAAATVAETEFMLELADVYEWIRGVVGWADMESADAVQTLERLSRHPKFVGIRPMIHDIPDPDWMLGSVLTPAFEWLEASRLCFDALVKPSFLPNLLVLLKRHPGLKVVIDHGAKPEIRNNLFDGWAKQMRILSEQTGAMCKLSGLLTEAAPEVGFDEVSKYIQHLLDCFGPDRLMWGSDWPVLNLASNYSDWILVCEKALCNLSEADQIKVWYENTERFYFENI